MFWGKAETRVYEAASSGFSIKVIETLEDTYYSVVKETTEEDDDARAAHGLPRVNFPDPL